MKKIADAAYEIITQNAALHFGLHHRLLNLSQVARFIRPLVEARTHKTVRDSALLVSLSRLQAKLPPTEKIEDLAVDKINIHTGLCSLTVSKTPTIQVELNRLFTRIRGRGGAITMSEGTTEVTAIIEDANFELATQMLGEKPRHVHRDLAAVGVKFDDQQIVRPGILYQLIQQVSLQGINIVEATSTATEFHVYVRSEDARLAFDSIYQRFSERSSAKTSL